MTDPAAVPVPRPRRPIDWRWVLRVAPLIFGVLFIGWMMWTRLPGAGDAPMDARILLTHAKVVRSGSPLYWPWPDFGPHYMTEAAGYPINRNPYPPFLTVVLSLVTPLDSTLLYRSWYILLFAAYWVYANALSVLALKRFDLRGTIAAGTIIAIFPVTWAPFNTGNVDPILWALIGSALAYPSLRGAGFMLPAMVKLYGVWPLMAAGHSEGVRVIRQAMIVLVTGLLVSGAILGPSRLFESFIDWFRWMLPTAGQGTWHHWNVSLNFLGLRLTEAAGFWTYREGPLPLPARLYLTAVAIGAPLIVMCLTRRYARILRYALVTCSAVLFSPICWVGYTPLLFAPAAIYFGQLHRKSRNDSAG